MLGKIRRKRRVATSLLLQGLACGEIAQRIKISDASARNLDYRGLEQLRGQLI